MKSKNKIYVSEAEDTRRWIQEEDLMVICRAWRNYEGDLAVFEGAVGAYFLGRFAGYDALRVVHSWRTLRKYEQILGIRFKEQVNGRTPDSRRVNGIRYAENFQAFWKAIAAGVSSQEEAKSMVSA